MLARARLWAAPPIHAPAQLNRRASRGEAHCAALHCVDHNAPAHQTRTHTRCTLHHCTPVPPAVSGPLFPSFATERGAAVSSHHEPQPLSAVKRRFAMATAARPSSLLPLACALLLSACTPSLPLVVAQFVALPLPSPCPSGRDCVGQQLGPRNAILCTLPEFAGFTCGGGSNLTLCPSGQVCPDAVTQLVCPAGGWCPQGSSKPFDCAVGGLCGEGSYKMVRHTHSNSTSANTRPRVLTRIDGAGRVRPQYSADPLSHHSSASVCCDFVLCSSTHLRSTPPRPTFCS